MIKDVKKTIPSEDTDIAWLAGIVDGEGSIGIYTSSQNAKIINLSIVNSDENIIDKIKSILEKMNIFYSIYIHNNKKPLGFIPSKQCYVVTIRRREDFEEIVTVLAPFLVGMKREKAMESLEYLAKNPRKIKPIYHCFYCKKIMSGRKRKFCNQDCWHSFSVGENNPNFRHGKSIACND